MITCFNRTIKYLFAGDKLKTLRVNCLTSLYTLNSDFFVQIVLYKLRNILQTYRKPFPKKQYFISNRNSQQAVEFLIIRRNV